MEGAHQILTFNDAALIGFGIWLTWKVAKGMVRWAREKITKH